MTELHDCAGVHIALPTMCLVDMLNQLYYNNNNIVAVMLIVLVTVNTAVMITWMSNHDEHLKANHCRVCEFKKRLTNLDLYILDNSIRESTVGRSL